MTGEVAYESAGIRNLPPRRIDLAGHKPYVEGLPDTRSHEGIGRSSSGTGVRQLTACSPGTETTPHGSPHVAWVDQGLGLGMGTMKTVSFSASMEKLAQIRSDEPDVSVMVQLAKPRVSRMPRTSSTARGMGTQPSEAK